MTTPIVPPVTLDWCDEARAILKLKRKKSLKELAKRITQQTPEKELLNARKNVDARLTQLKVIADDTVCSPYEARYQVMIAAIEARLAPAASVSKDDVKAIAAKAHEMHALADELTAALKSATAAKLKLEAFDRNVREANRDMAILAAGKGNTDNLSRILKEAEDLGAAKEYDKADTVLVTFQNELATQQKSIKIIDARKLEQLSLEPQYGLKLAELEQHLAEVRDLPGITKTVNEFLAVIEAAQTKAQIGDFKQGIVELAKGKALPTAAECARLSNEALAAFESSSPSGGGEWDAAQRALTGLKAISVPEEYVSQRAQVTRLGDQMVQNTVGAAAALVQLTTQITARTDDLHRQQSEAAKALRMSVGTLKTLRDYAGMELVAQFSQRLESLTTTLTSGRVEAAYEPALELDKELIAVTADYHQRKQQWVTDENARCKPLLNKVETMILHCPPNAQRARVLKGSLSALSRFATVDPKDPVGAIDQLDRLEAEVNVLQTSYELYQEFDTERDDAEKARTAFEDAAKTALGGLGAAITAARAKQSNPSRDGAAAFLPFDLNCAELLDRWRRAIDTALAADLLKTPAFTTQADTLLKRIEHASSGDALNQAVGQQQQDEGRRRYETDREVLVRELDQLSAFDYTESDKLMAELSALDKLASKDYVVAGLGLAKLNSRSAKRLAAVKQHRDSIKMALDTSVADVTQMMAKLKKLIKDKAFRPFVTNLETELADMSGMFTTNNINTMYEASDLLLALKARMRQLLVDMSSETKADFNFVSAVIKEIGKKLGDDSGNDVFKALTECAPATLELLKKRFEGTKEDAYTQLPSDALVTLQALDTDIDSNGDVAKVAKAVRDAFAEELKAVKVKIKRFDKSHQFLLGVASRLTKLEGRILKEGQESKALDGLTELKIELNQALTNPAFLLKLDEAASKKALKEEQDKVVWQKRLQLFQTVDYQKAKVAVKTAKGDGTLIDELDRMIKSMKQIAKSGSFDDANQQLVFAKQRVREIVKRPEGPTIGSRNDLPKDLTVFKKAVRTYNDAMRAFPGAVRALEDATSPLPPASHRAIESITSKVQRDINESAFDKLVATLSSKATDRNKRRAARENALSLIRTYQSRLQTSKTMEELIKNPVDRKQIPPAMSGMYYALNRLQGNVLRCCK